MSVALNKIFFRIREVDIHGYQGRDYHPDFADIGKIVRPIKLQVAYIDSEGFGEEIEPENPIPIEALPYLNGKEGDGSGLEICWTCVTDDGKILQLMDFELELLV